jgi:hypothetical protein
MAISQIGTNGIANGAIVTADIATGVTLTTPVIDTITSAAATALTLKSAGTTAVTIDTSQNVGIGNTSPSDYRLVVDGEGSTGGFALKRTGTLTGSGSLRLVGSSGSEALGFSVNGSEKMRIDASGNLLLGTTTSITQANVMVQKNNSTNNAMVTYAYTASAGSSATVTFSTASLGFSNVLFYCVEVTASAYGNGNTGVGTYKGMVTGYSGGSIYQAVTNIVSTMTAGGSFSLAGGTNTATLTINNTDGGGNQKFGVVRFNVTWQ